MYSRQMQTLGFVAIVIIVSVVGNSITTLAFADQPNVVVIYSDDAGYADFGFQPNCAPEMKNLTPHIDSIADRGARFANAYMSGCVCSPSRAGLMTARYQQRFGFGNNLPPDNKNGLDVNETFAVKRLANIGYKTGIVGKWHLGYLPAHHPNQRGFDWFFGLLQGSRSYFPIENVSRNRVIQENNQPTDETGYITDRFGDAAVRFINEHKADPFFLFVSFTAPHSPNQPKTTDLPRVSHIEKLQRKRFAGLVVAMDDNVGKILAAINNNGLDRNTIVIFTNDNGGQTLTGAANTPLRGRKGQLTEGGIRVPWAMRWPEKISPGTVIDDPVIALDMFPTLIEAAGGKISQDWNWDGRSFMPLLNGKPMPDRTLYWREGGKTGSIAVREGNWKYLHQNRIDSDQSFELYDLSNDISESKNLASKHPEIIERLKSKASTWEKELIEPLWVWGNKTRSKNQKQPAKKSKAG